MEGTRERALKDLHFKLGLMRDFSVDQKDRRALDNAANAVYGVLVREKQKGEKEDG